MANGQISKKFLFGTNNSPIYMPATPEYDFFIGIPERQKKLVKLAQSQILAQKEIAKTIESSNLQIANEIKQFSANLEESVTNLSTNITQVGDNILTAIDSLEYSITCEFREVRWLISQLSDNLTEIINILKNKRKFEANELLEQALSNLKNGYYNEAKDRLIKAMDFDNTDYQIHRNLGFVFLHDDNSDKTIEHFQKSVAFSPNDKWKVDALADLSRAYYAIENYSKSLEYLDEIFVISGQKRDIIKEDEYARILYNYSVYSALEGNVDISIKHLDKAITLRRSYFVLATFDQDFKNIRKHIDQFLADKVNLALQEAEYSLNLAVKLREELKNEINYGYNSQRTVDQALYTAKFKLDNSSYTDLLDIKVNSSIIYNSLKIMKDIYHIRTELESTDNQLGIDIERLNKFEEKEREERKRLEEKEREERERLEEKEREERERLEIKERKRRNFREFKAKFIHRLVVFLSFTSVAIITFFIVGATWKGCHELIVSAPRAKWLPGEDIFYFQLKKGYIETIKPIFLMIIALAIEICSVAAPFFISAKVSEFMDNYMRNYVANMRKIKHVSYLKLIEYSYLRPIEHEELISRVNNKKSMSYKLKDRLHNLMSELSNLLSKINWTVK